MKSKFKKNNLINEVTFDLTLIDTVDRLNIKCST